MSRKTEAKKIACRMMNSHEWVETWRSRKTSNSPSVSFRCKRCGKLKREGNNVWGGCESWMNVLDNQFKKPFHE